MIASDSPIYFLLILVIYAFYILFRVYSELITSRRKQIDGLEVNNNNLALRIGKVNTTVYLSRLKKFGAYKVGAGFNYLLRRLVSKCNLEVGNYSRKDRFSFLSQRSER